MTKFTSSQCGKSNKNDLKIISKPHAHTHTMKKTHAKFQNNRYKTVRGVALTKGTHCLYIDGEKENTNKVSKRSVQNCKRSCAHNTPRVNVDGRTNGRTDGRKHACISRPC